MTKRRPSWAILLLAWLSASAFAAPAGPAGLPVIGPAPAFVLDSATGPRVALTDLRGKVLVLTFVFTTCTSTCPILTAKLVDVARALGSDFGNGYAFVAVSGDPLHDTPARLRDYARAQGADTPGWFFLTGAPGDIGAVVQRYGAYAKKTDGGAIEHLFLSSLIDRSGRLRVQYLGTRFDPREMLRDLQRLAHE